MKENKTLSREDLENTDPRLLFQAMVGVVGLGKTQEIFSYYFELEEAGVGGECKQPTDDQQTTSKKWKAVIPENFTEGLILHLQMRAETYRRQVFLLYSLVGKLNPNLGDEGPLRKIYSIPGPVEKALHFDNDWEKILDEKVDEVREYIKNYSES